MKLIKYINISQGECASGWWGDFVGYWLGLKNKKRELYSDGQVFNSVSAHAYSGSRR